MNSGLLINSGVVLLYSGVLFRNPNEINEALCAGAEGAAYVDIFHSFIHASCVHTKQFQIHLYYSL